MYEGWIYDFKKPLLSKSLKIALQYVQNFDGLILSFPLKNIGPDGQMHEETLTQLWTERNFILQELV